MNRIQIAGRIGLLGTAAALAACGGDSTGPPAEPLEITTTALADALVDAPYTEGLNADGGNLDYDWSIVTGVLPPGLDFSLEDLPDGDDIVISGTPGVVGSYTFTVQVESEDGQTDSRQYTIQVLPPADLAIANIVLPPALRDGPYDVPLRATGGTGQELTWSLDSGALPPGLTLDPEGRIEGTPTATDTAELVLRLEAGGEIAVEAFELRVIANRPSTYDITAVAVSSVPAGIQPHLDEAIALWEEAITGDLVPIAIPATFFGPSGCGGFGQAVNGTTVEDLLVLVNIAEIDGVGDVLGQAGPCAIRDSSQLPVAGILTLDSEDLLPLVGSITLTHLIAHEIGHVLGFGSLWGATLLSNEGSSDPQFTGAQAVEEWHDLGGSGNVPVESTGGEGTADSHWRESVFDRELMTGFSEAPGVFQPLSRVTIGSLEDLGYTVDYGAADSYTLGFALLAPGAASGANLGRDIVLDEGIRVIDDSGTPIELKTRMGGSP